MFIHDIDNVAFHIGSFAVRWYGLAYIAGIAGGWILGRMRAKSFARSNPASRWSPDDVDNLIIYAAVGMVLGARLGYILFYDLTYYIKEPAAMLKLWEGGMSFHGGLIGMTAALCWFAKKTGRSLLQVSDFIVPLVPLGLMTGRLANFINGELWGSVTTMPWGVVFKGAGHLPRHPSQLYEAALEGLVLGIILWVYSSKPRALGRVSGLFLIGYGCFRFAIEFVRLPDSQLGYLAFGWLTMGQILCLPMLAVGAWWFFRKPGETDPATASNHPAAKVKAGASGKKR